MAAPFLFMEHNEFTLTGIHRTLEGLLRSIDHSLRDAIIQGVDVTTERLRRMRELGEKHYRLEVVDKWMEWYGLVKRQVNRAKHKKFLPDGSWISNGVRFGG